jgi:hypothetical protein
VIRYLAQAIVVAAIMPTDLIAEELPQSADPFGVKDFQQVARLIEASDCDQAWRLLWKATLAGSSNAAMILVWESSYGRLVPPFLPVTEPDNPNELDAAWKQAMSFFADVAFTIKPEQIPQDTEEQQGNLFEFKGAVLENSWAPSSFQRYGASGCLSAGAAKTCTDPQAWAADVRDLAHWDAMWLDGKTPHATASCKDAWHAYRNTLSVD